MIPRLELNLSSNALYLHLSDNESAETPELTRSMVFCDLGPDGELVGVEIIMLHGFLYAEPVKHELISELDEILREEVEGEESEPADSLEIGLEEQRATQLLAAISSAVELEALDRIEQGLKSLSTLEALPGFHV